MGLENLIKKARVGFLTTAIATSMYFGSLYNNSYSEENKEDVKAESVNKEKFKYTSNETDFYKNPKKEFKNYRDTYVKLAKDGVIDSNDVEKIEEVLSLTLNEIKSKIYNEDGSEKDSIGNFDELRNYVNFYKKFKDDDLIELRIHLEKKKDWIDSYAVNNKFWNYGSGLCFYAGSTDNGNPDGRRSENYISRNPIIKAQGLEELFKEDFYHFTYNYGSEFNHSHVPDLSVEYPAKTKFNYWLGLGLGLTFPIGIGLLGLKRKYNNKKTLDADDAAGFILGSFIPTVIGFGILDSLHPLCYPTRLAIPAIYEGYQWMFKNKKSKTEEDKEENTKVKENIQPISLEINQKNETEFINPWEIDIPKIENKTMKPNSGGNF